MSGTTRSERERATPTADSRQGRFPSPAISAAIARVELRRGLRRIREQDVWLAVMAVGALAVLVTLPTLFGAAHGWGAELAAGDAESTGLLITLFAVMWVLFFGITIASAVGSYGEVDNEAGMLTIRPPKDVAGGLLASTALWLAPYLIAPLVGLLGLAAGAGTPAPLAGGIPAIALLLITAVAAGYPLGVAIKAGMLRSALLSRLKPVIGAVVAVIYFWIMFAGHVFAIVAAIAPALYASPIGWLGDLALLTTPGADVSIARAAGAVALSSIVVPVGTLATVRAGRYAWYADEARSTEDDADGEGDSEGDAATERLAAALGIVARRPGTVGVATTTLVRAYRAPLQLVFVALPLLVALPTFERIATTGTAPAYAPWMVMLYGAWAAGTAFPLNALGNQGPTLPALLTARADGRRVVHGTVLAAVLPFGPLTAVLAAGAARLAGRSSEAIVAFAGLSLVVVAAGAVVAAGLGALFPRFETIDVSGDRTATPPSKAAFSLFSMAVALAVNAVGVLSDEVLATLLSAALSERLPGGIDVSAAALETAAWVAVPLLVVAVPVAYRLAVRRIDDYRLG